MRSAVATEKMVPITGTIHLGSISMPRVSFIHQAMRPSYSGVCTVKPKMPRSIISCSAFFTQGAVEKSISAALNASMSCARI